MHQWKTSDIQFHKYTMLLLFFLNFVETEIDTRRLVGKKESQRVKLCHGCRKDHDQHIAV